MAEGRRGCGTWLLGAAVVTALSAVACCGCGGLGVVFAPNLLVAAFAWFLLEDAPLGPPPVPLDAATREQVIAKACGDLWAGTPTKIDPALLTGALAYGAGPEIAHLSITPVGDGWSMAVSIRPEGDTRYINLSGTGTFVMEHGWFTDARLDAVRLAGFDLGVYVQGQQIAENMNQSLANQRAKSPEIAPVLESFDRISTPGGQLELVPGPGAAENLEICAAYRPVVPPVPAEPIPPPPAP